MVITDSASFLDYLSRIRGRTLAVGRVIPEDRLEWRPTEGAFSFGDLLRHLAAIERYMFAENARLQPARYPARVRHDPRGVVPADRGVRRRRIPRHDAAPPGP